MAVNNGKREQTASFRLSLLKQLTLAPEARSESRPDVQTGRIKRYFDIIKKHFQQITVINTLSLIFALPLIAFIAYINFRGIENFTYVLEGMKSPYLLSVFGIGLSSGESLPEVKLALLSTYRIISLAAAVGLSFMSFGFAGILHVGTKLVWGESFICKKDKFGNDVPRIVLEFFRGVKLYWKQSLLVTSVFALFLAAGANLVIGFVGGLYSGGPNGVQIFGFIMAIILVLLSALIFVNLFPLIASYRIKFRDKLKNALIMSLVFFIPSLVLVIVAAIPMLLALAGGLLVTFLLLFYLLLGISLTLIMFINYADYNAEKILTPLYESSLAESKKTKKSTKNVKKGNKK